VIEMISGGFSLAYTTAAIRVGHLLEEVSHFGKCFLEYFVLGG